MTTPTRNTATRANPIILADDPPLTLPKPQLYDIPGITLFQNGHTPENSTHLETRVSNNRRHPYLESDKREILQGTNIRKSERLKLSLLEGWANSFEAFREEIKSDDIRYTKLVSELFPGSKPEKIVAYSAGVNKNKREDNKVTFAAHYSSNGNIRSFTLDKKDIPFLKAVLPGCFFEAAYTMDRGPEKEYSILDKVEFSDEARKITSNEAGKVIIPANSVIIENDGYYTFYRGSIYSLEDTVDLVLRPHSFSEGKKYPRVYHTPAEIFSDVESLDKDPIVKKHNGNNLKKGPKTKMLHNGERRYLTQRRSKMKSIIREWDKKDWQKGRKREQANMMLELLTGYQEHEDNLLENELEELNFASVRDAEDVLSRILIKDTLSDNEIAMYRKFRPSLIHAWNKQPGENSYNYADWSVNGQIEADLARYIATLSGPILHNTAGFDMGYFNSKVKHLRRIAAMKQDYMAQKKISDIEREMGVKEDITSSLIELSKIAYSWLDEARNDKTLERASIMEDSGIKSTPWITDMLGHYLGDEYHSVIRFGSSAKRGKTEWRDYDFVVAVDDPIKALERMAKVKPVYKGKDVSIIFVSTNQMDKYFQISNSTHTYLKDSKLVFSDNGFDKFPETNMDYEIAKAMFSFAARSNIIHGLAKHNIDDPSALMSKEGLLKAVAKGAKINHEFLQRVNEGGYVFSDDAEIAYKEFLAKEGLKNPEDFLKSSMSSQDVKDMLAATYVVSTRMNEKYAGVANTMNFQKLFQN